MNNTRVIVPVDMQQVIEYIKNNLALDVKTQSHYVGCMGDGDSLYKESHTISIVLDGYVISSIDI